MKNVLSDAAIAAEAIIDAARGDAEAQAYLGRAYTHGWEGFPCDPERALHWFRLAAAQEEPSALFNLAWLHDAGEGVARDTAQAERLYARAAAAGHAGAIEEMALRSGHRAPTSSRR